MNKLLKIVVNNLINLSKWRALTTLQGHSGYVNSIAFSPDSKYLASCSDDNMVKIWSVESQTEITTLQEHSANVYSVAFSPDGKYLASGN
jgi:WD40 repeat protein